MATKNEIYREAIKKTLLYSSIFKYPITYYQILNFLIIDEQNKIDIKIFETELAKLIKQKYVNVKDERCYLPGVKYNNWNKAGKISKKLFKKNKYVIKNLTKIPWIKYIGATGSYAAKNSNNKSDLDLFIITQKNRVWITRLFVTILLKFVFKNYVVKGIDPNIYISESSMKWPSSSRNLYVANEIIRMETLFDRDNYYFSFIKNNKWVLDYAGNFKSYYQNIKNKSNKYNSEPLMNLLDTLLMKMQINYMKNKITSEVVKKDFIHFNKNDSTHPVLSRYKQKIETL